jgi:hypothetical protein
MSIQFASNDSFRMTTTSGNNVVITTVYTDAASVSHTVTTKSSGLTPVEVIPVASYGLNTIVSITIENKDDASQDITLYSAQQGILHQVTIPTEEEQTYTSDTWNPVTGIPNVQGQTGIQGFTGIQGQTGVQGITGLNGITGLMGITGIRGITGVSGLQGITGTQGIVGDQGITGLMGITGIRGITGVSGLQGITGTQGIVGDQGITGMVVSDPVILSTVGVTGMAGMTGGQLTFDGSQFWGYDGSNWIILG